MIAYQPRRLISIFSKPLAQLKAEDIVAAVASGNLREEEDLDFKEKNYAADKAEDAKRELAKDIASFANAQGGIIIIGVAEQKGVATSTAPLDCSDLTIRTLRGAITGFLAPTPVFGVDPVPFSDRPYEGFILVSVPRSTDAPHAVRLDRGITYRYPRRVGTETVFLSEAQVADAYRNRFSAAREQLDYLDEVEEIGISRLSEQKGWLHLTIIPNSLADINLDLAALSRYREWARGIRSLVPETGPFEGKPVSSTTRARCLVLGPPEALGEGDIESTYCELHINGAGFAAIPVYDIEKVNRGGLAYDVAVDSPILDEDLVLHLSGLLTLLADHAITHGGLVGDAIVRVSIFNPEQFLLGGVKKTAKVGIKKHDGLWETTRKVEIFPSSEHSISLIGALQSGPEHLLTLRLMLTELFQAFGLVELPQIDMHGQIRSRYWDHMRRNALKKWARLNGAELHDRRLEEG